MRDASDNPICIPIVIARSLRFTQAMNPMSLFLAAILAFAPAALAAQAADARPNIIIIIADDLGYADVGFNGGKTIRTPNLDRLAATGVRLTNFRVAPVCSPTRAGFLTGRWPNRFGMMRAVVPPWSKYGFPQDETTLPEALAKAGYERRGLIGKWHLGHARRERLPLAHGFNHFYGHYNGAIDYFTHHREGELDWHRNDESIREDGYSTDLLAAEAARFIKSAPAENPWFLYVAFNAPHSPFQAKPDDLKKYSGLTRREQTYAAMVDSMDQGIGKILAAVESLPTADNTLILFFSDNGGAARSGSSNDPWRGDKASVYEGGTRAAAAMRWPKAKIAGGKQFDGRIGYIDVMPTVLKSTGAALTENLDGIDFLPALRGERELPTRPWFSYIHQGPDAQASVHLENWKLIAHGEARHELYDLSKDPAEASDVAGANPEIVARLRGELQRFFSWSKEGVSNYDEGRAGFKAPKDWIVQ